MARALGEECRLFSSLIYIQLTSTRFTHARLLLLLLSTTSRPIDGCVHSTSSPRQLYQVLTSLASIQNVMLIEFDMIFFCPVCVRFVFKTSFDTLRQATGLDFFFVTFHAFKTKQNLGENQKRQAKWRRRLDRYLLGSGSFFSFFILQENTKRAKLIISEGLRGVTAHTHTLHYISRSNRLNKRNGERKGGIKLFFFFVFFLSIQHRKRREREEQVIF